MRRAVSALLLVAGSLVGVLSPGAQQTTERTSSPQAGSLEFAEVRRGMARDLVVAGLTGRYHLKKEEPSDAGLDVWDVSDSNAFLGEIIFQEEKVFAVRENILREQPAGPDALPMAQALFAELHNHTRPVQNPDKLDGLTGAREGTATITVREFIGDQFDMKQLSVDIDNSRLLMEIRHDSELPNCHSGCVSLIRIR
jgi:hypothetical protein